MLNAVSLYHAFYPSQHLSFLFLPLPELPNSYEHSIIPDFCFDSSLQEQPRQQPQDLKPILPAFLPPTSFQLLFSLFASPSSFDSWICLHHYHQLPAIPFLYSYYHLYLLALMNLFQDLQEVHPAQRLPQLSVTFSIFSSQPPLVQFLHEKQ